MAKKKKSRHKDKMKDMVHEEKEMKNHEKPMKEKMHKKASRGK